MKKTGLFFTNNVRSGDGCTMRDYFAGLAMQSMMVDVVKTQGFSGFDMEFVSESAYKMADEMLKVRVK